MVTQSGDPNNKSKPAYKKYCSYCHKNNHGISNCYQKQRDEEYQRYKNQRSRLLTSPFYNMSAVNLVIHKKIEMKTKMIIFLDNDHTRSNQNTTPITTTDIDIKTDIEVIVEIIHKIITDLTLDKDITIDL